MHQTKLITNEHTPAKKAKLMEINAELRDLKDKDSLADYERVKGTLAEWEWSELKERIRVRFDNTIKERDSIFN